MKMRDHLLAKKRFWLALSLASAACIVVPLMISDEPALAWRQWTVLAGLGGLFQRG